MLVLESFKKYKNGTHLAYWGAILINCVNTGQFITAKNAVSDSLPTC